MTTLNEAELILHRHRARVSAIILVLVFLVVHAWLLYASLGPEEVAARDVGLYQWWMDNGRATGEWPGLHTSWVYPILALLPMLATLAVTVVTPLSYMVTWWIMVMIINAAVCIIVWRQAGPLRAAPALGFWLVFLGLLGPVGLMRVDAVATPLVLIALLVATRHPAVSTVLVTVGAWIKVSPGAIVIALFALVKRRWSQVVAYGAATCAVVLLGTWVFAIGPSRIFAFFTDQATRGLQIESVAATPVVFFRWLTNRELWVYNDELLTVETAGSLAPKIAGVMDIVLIVLLVGIGLLAFRARRAGPEALLFAALAISSALIVANKVGSPQFVAWLAPAVVVGLAHHWRNERWRLAALILLLTALMTQAIYPIGYDKFLTGWLPMILVVMARNALIVALLVMSTLWLWKCPRSHQVRPA